MKKIIFLLSALVVALTGCATTNGAKSYYQGETARFLRNNINPDTIIIEDASTERYSGNSSWYFWTAITPNGSIYKCQAFSGDKTCYCRESKINNSEKSKKFP